MYSYRNKTLFLALLSGLAIVCISFAKTALELEDAEQAYYSQWWRLGYDDQPPLYTWLQIIINSIFGLSKFSLSFLRAILFSSVIYTLCQFGNTFLNSKCKALSVVLGLALIPTFIDFAFRRLSHTTLLCLVSVLTYMLVYRLIQKKSLSNYALFGFVIGLGILTKYNYVLILIALAGTVFFDKEAQRIFYNKKILITICLPLLMFLPHGMWLVNEVNFDNVLNAVASKTETSEVNGMPIVSPVLSLLITSIKLISPICILLVLGMVKKKVKFKSPSRNARWLFNSLLSQIVIVLLIFVLLDIREVETRWLLPLFLPFLVLLPVFIDNLILSKWNSVGMYVFCIVLFAQIIRTPVEKLFHIPSSVHFGYGAISDVLQKTYSYNQWMLPNVTYGGNVRLLNKNKEIFVLDDFSLPKAKINESKTIFMVVNTKDKPKNSILADSIMGFGKEKENLFCYKLIP